MVGTFHSALTNASSFTRALEQAGADPDRRLQGFSSNRCVELIRNGAIAGIAGGLAEIACVSLYAVLSGADAGAVARGVTAAVIGGSTAAPVTAGIVIHMSLAVVLGVALVLVLRSYCLRSSLASYVAAIIVLTGVWAVNFLIVLPQLSPDFLGLLPYEATLVSKLWFALAAAWTFRRLRSA
jgi:hypothetical protein